MPGKALAVFLVVLNVASFGPHALRATQSDTVIAMERAALDRWGKGDPQGYLEIYAPEVTYFDPMQPKRVDGLEAMKALLIPLTGKFTVDRFEMLDPKVQRHGDVSILTFNLVSHGRTPAGEAMVVHWNATAVYARLSGKWQLIHHHWSFAKPGG
jgi:ketosteroid isomerase-like protein